MQDDSDTPPAGAPVAEEEESQQQPVAQESPQLNAIRAVAGIVRTKATFVNQAVSFSMEES